MSNYSSSLTSRPWPRWVTSALFASLLVASACSDSRITSPARTVAPASIGADASATATHPGHIQAGGALVNGQNHTGNITTAGQTDTWTFTANTGDLIALAIGEITGSASFTPWIQLKDPSGTLIGNQWNVAAAQIQVAAPATGTYTVLAATADAAHSATGTYNLTLALAPGPTPVVSPGDQGGPLTNGGLSSGSIFIGDLDQWTFTANQGDFIAVAVGEVTGTPDFTPWIRLVAPNGQLLGNQWNVQAAQIAVNATLTGTYTLIVSTADGGNDATGDYQLSLVKGPGSLTIAPGDQGGDMTNGAIHTGTINVGDLDGWQFAANQGDAIMLAVGEISGTTDFTPWIRLVAPNGQLLGNQWNVAAAQIQVNAPLTGTYTVIVSTADGGNDATGDYRLNLALAPGNIVVSPGDEGGPATNGLLHTGTIDVGDLDVWTFTATQGFPMAISIGEISGTTDFTPWIRLVAPNGQIIGNQWNVAAAQINVIGPLTGTYTVVVSTADGGNDATGTYRLNVHKNGGFQTSPGDQGGAIAIGANTQGDIVVGDLDRFQFNANQGDYIAVNVGEISGTIDFTPWIRLVSPTGQILGNQWNVAAAQISVNAPATGVYTIAVGTADGGNDATGTYTLTVQKGPGSFIVPAGDNGGPISNGNFSGNIFVGDTDPWSVTAVAGAPISLTVSKVSGTTDFTPWIRLVAPNGQLIGNQWSTTSATINVTAPQTGTYLIIIATADAGNDATGTYNLSVAGVNMVPRPPVAPPNER